MGRPIYRKLPDGYIDYDGDEDPDEDEEEEYSCNERIDLDYDEECY